MLFYAGISRLGGWLLDFQEGLCHIHFVIGKGILVPILFEQGWHGVVGMMNRLGAE
jgi:hypothetical protein